MQNYITVLFSDVSPRLSSRHASARIHVEQNSDPYGVLSVEPSGGASAEPGSVAVTVRRTGSSLGRVTAALRTVGGGEPWDYTISTLNAGRRSLY